MLSKAQAATQAKLYKNQLQLNSEYHAMQDLEQRAEQIIAIYKSELARANTLAQFDKLAKRFAADFLKPIASASKCQDAASKILTDTKSRPEFKTSTEIAKLHAECLTQNQKLGAIITRLQSLQAAVTDHSSKVRERIALLDLPNTIADLEKRTSKLCLEITELSLRLDPNDSQLDRITKPLKAVIDGLEVFNVEAHTEVMSEPTQDSSLLLKY